MYKHRQQIGGCHRGRGVEEGKMGKGGPIFSDGEKLQFWW